MHDPTTKIRAKHIAAVVLLVALVAGCTQTRDWLAGRRTAEPTENVMLGAPEIDRYIEEIYALSGGDPATQAEIFTDAQSAAQLTPGPSTRLRYAMVLATPGHPGSDPQEAQRIFRDLLAQTELMTQSEIALATIHLKVVEEQIVLAAETRRLRAENTRAATTEEQAVSQRVARIEAENRRLQRSLEEAEEKLEALMSIERSIREQSDDGEN